MRYSAAAPMVLILGMIVASLLWITSNVVSNAKRQAEDGLKKLMSIVEVTDTLKDRTARAFLYMYGPSALGINVEDKGVADWKTAHDHAVEQGNLRAPSKQGGLRASSQSKHGQSWLDLAFVDTTSSYGTAFTPHLANSIPYAERQSDIRLRDLSDFRLRFARDSGNGTLYILGHLVTTMDIGNDIVLRLTTHYSDLQKRVFRIDLKNNGELESDVGVSGTWWISESDWFFELALEIPQADAIELVATLGTDANLYRIGADDPLPLHEELNTYEIARNLYSFAPHYAVYRGEHWLSGNRYLEDEPKDDAGIRLNWVLAPLYRFYFKSCGKDNEWETGACLLNRGGEYWLRVLRILKDDADVIKPIVEEAHKVGISVGKALERHAPVSVLTENLLVVPFGIGSVLAMSSIVALGSLTFYAERRRRRAFRRLEQTNNRLEQINETLQSYVPTFIHQAARLLTNLETEALKVVGERGAARVCKLVDEIERRLRDSTEKLVYETKVHDRIHEYEQCRGFDLPCSVNALVEIFLENRIRDIEFRNNALPHYRRPVLLRPTGPPDNPDGYFTEAMEAIIQNAVDYREPEDSKITVSLDVEFADGTSYGILKVSNFGPCVPKNKHRDVFKPMHRYTAAMDQESSPLMSRDQSEHQGLGLFMTSQIVRGYRGNCRLDNLPGDKGVVVTVRLPVEFGPLPT